VVQPLAMMASSHTFSEGRIGFGDALAEFLMTAVQIGPSAPTAGRHYSDVSWPESANGGFKVERKGKRPLRARAKRVYSGQGHI
jgi:hypothetical protein